jgi:hypothetical protein
LKHGGEKISRFRKAFLDCTEPALFGSRPAL